MLQNWRIYRQLYFKTKMDVPSLIFEPRPLYFVKKHNFSWWTNDNSMTFWYFYWFHIWKFLLELSYPVLESSLTTAIWQNFLNFTCIWVKITGNRKRFIWKLEKFCPIAAVSRVSGMFLKLIQPGLSLSCSFIIV